VDEQAAGLLKNKDYAEASRVWEHNSEKDTAKALLYKKNLAILHCLLLFKKNSKTNLTQSLKLWKELLDSEKFWGAFAKVYKLHDELGTSQEIVDEFKSHAISYVADIYTELGQFHDDDAFVAESSKILEAKGAVTEKAVLNPIYQSVAEVVDKLESLKVGEDGKIDKEESQTLKVLIGKLQEAFNKLIEIGLYEDSQSKTMRDRAANAIRVVVLDLHNNLNETDKALALMNVALKIAGTSGTEAKVKHDIRVLEETKKNAGLVSPIVNLIAEEKFEEALKQIEIDRKRYSGNVELQEFYDTQKKISITMMALKKYNQAREYFDKQQENLAKPLFEEAGKLILDNIDLYNFNKKVIEELVAEIKSNMAKVSLRNLNQFDEYRNSYVNLAKDKFEGQFEQWALIVIVDANIFGGLTGFMKTARQKNNVANILYTLGWITVWFYGIGLIFFIAGWIYKNRNT
jgi:tetratricopeptide (TPR) repeat protein